MILYYTILHILLTADALPATERPRLRVFLDERNIHYAMLCYAMLCCTILCYKV